MLELVDRIAELPPSKFKNKSIFPSLTDTDTTFTILSYAFYLHKSKVLLRRLSRTGLLMGTCAEDSSI